MQTAALGPGGLRNQGGSNSHLQEELKYLRGKVDAIYDKIK